jgi:hypothetical protein
VSERAAFAIAPAIPLHQDPNGDQVESEWKLAVTFSTTF